MNEIIGIDIERAYTAWSKRKKEDGSYRGKINKKTFSKEIGITYRMYHNHKNGNLKYAEINLLEKLSKASGIPEEELKIKKK